MDSNAFLFVWNPNNWPFEELPERIEELHVLGRTKVLWSIAAYKQVKIGDRAFICRVGGEPKGLFASGIIISKPDFALHWSGTKMVRRLLIELDVLINPSIEKILSIEILKQFVSEQQHWTPQGSGIRIDQQYIEKLEKLWLEFLFEQNIIQNSNNEEQVLIEGTPYQVTQTLYERNRYARYICLKTYGYSCAVCGFNFKDKFGDLGEGFIHVHHLNPLSLVSKQHRINPILNLRPVCPNCHAMLHRRTPAFTIDELKDIRKKDG